MNIKDTAVYKYNAPMIRKQDRDEFARMLQLAFSNKKRMWADFGAERLFCAFPWGNSPQGYEYWEELTRRIEEYLS